MIMKWQGFLIIYISQAALAAPSWVNTPTKLSNGKLTVSCNASGPDSSSARISAIDECRKIANEYLNNEIEVTTVSVETEQSTSLHSSVKSHSKIKNLTCTPIKEEVVEKEENQTAYLLCQFDLKKVHTESVKEGVSVGAKSRLNALEQVPVKTFKAKRSVASTRRILSITSIPQCQTIVIQGKRPNIIKCSENPTQLVIDSEYDSALIIRANGYIPKTILVQDILEENLEVLQVILNRN